jgi:polysaccharide biosynthesis protein PslG
MAFRRWRIPGLVLCMGLALLAAQAGAVGGTAPQSPAIGRVGLSTSTVLLPPGQRYAYLKQARDIGVTWVREDFAWSTIEAQRGQFDWRTTDALMRSAGRLGINVLAMAAWSPPWASGHPESNKYPPRNPADYARFVRAIAVRYGAGGTFWTTTPKDQRRPVTAIEIWNEPWHGHFWQPSPDPAAYARLVRAGATAIKAVHPEIKVLASGDIFQLTADGDDLGADWLGPLLAADPALWRSGLVNAWSVHVYCQRLSPWDNTAPARVRYDRVELTRAATVAAGAPWPIWITELGWNTGDRSDSVSEDIQALYTVDALRRATDQWGSFVPRSFIYTFDVPGRETEYNLLRPDGSARPAWTALKNFIAAPG